MWKFLSCEFSFVHHKKPAECWKKFLAAKYSFIALVLFMLKNVPKPPFKF